MSTAQKPLLVSVAGHVLLVAGLIWLVGRAPPLALPERPPQTEIEVAFTVPQPPPPPIPDPLAQREPEPPPIPEPPLVEPPPPAPVGVAEPPPPPPPPKPVVHKPPPRPPAERRVVTQPERPPPEPRVAPPMQTAALPPMPQPLSVAAPSPTISAGYRGLLSAWLESHKQYPQSARERGEQGRVVLRFRVARSGRVLDHAIAGGSGYPDLDSSVDAMMRGAEMPPFPADMTAPEIEVTVTVRFALTR